MVHLPELEKPHSKPSPAHSHISSEHNYALNVMHPLGQTTARYIVGDRFHDGHTFGHKRDTCKFHNMQWCPELLQFQSVTSEVINSRIKSTRLQSSSQQNIYHYYFYNRLMDYWHNLTIVQKQLITMEKKRKPGEVIVRDSLYRFVYAGSQ